MFVTFSDPVKTKLEYLKAIEKPEHFDNATRRVLTLELNPESTSLDKMHKLLSDKTNVKSLLLEGDPIPVYAKKIVTQEVKDAEGNPSATQQEIMVTDEQGQPVVDHYNTPSGIYDDYTMLLQLAVEPRLVQSETSDAPAEYANRLVIKLGKPTYTEAQLARLGL